MRALSVFFCFLAIILSDLMCAVTAYNYCDMLWGIRYAGYSAPASLAFLTAVPYAIGIIVSVILAIWFRKKAE